MPRPPRKCAFCDASATSKGGEHLWDDWLNEALPKKTRFHAKKRLSIDSPPIEFVQVGLQEQVPFVCAECNSGWMSDLTAKVKQRFSPAILDGTPFSVDARDAALLAAFTFMKAAIKDYCYGKDVFFSTAARKRLRGSLAIPPLVKIWFASFRGTSRFSFRSVFNIGATSEPGPLYGMEFFSYTYVVGKLTLQLLAPRWKDIFDGHRPLVTLTPNAYWNPAAVQFWPNSGESLSWPPPKYLGDDFIQQFIDRFQAPITLPSGNWW
jgi:hypothetical protein